MADPLQIKTSTRIINGISTRIETNVETGAANLYQDNGLAGRTLIATGSARGNTWTVTNAFAAIYSTRVGRTLTTSQAQTLFAKDFQNLANNDRASLINTWSSPNTKTFLATQAKVPGIVDPATGLKTGQTAQTTSTTTTSTTTPASTAGGSDPLTSQPIDPNAGGSISGNDLSTAKPSENLGLKVLKYPLYESRGYDYLKIRVQEYIPGGVPRLSDANLGVSDVQDRKTTDLGTIFLPMQPGISDSAGSSWNEDRLSPVQAALGSFATDTINAFGGLNGSQALKNIQGSLSGAQDIVRNNPLLGKFIDTYFAKQLVGSNLFARESGAVINPNLELLFDGPKMRTFNYNYRFTPRDNEEAKEVRRIIKFLKKNSQPKKDPNGLFLKTPNIFQLEYIYGETGEMHPFMNKIKKCALTDMSVNYTPDGSYMTYNDGSMTSYTVTLSFSELSPIYYDDFEDNESPTMDF